jgi:uncharacterized protein (DUF4415 family)
MKEKITRVTLEDIRSGKLKGETDWARVDAMTDEDIERAIAEDPDSDFDLANSTLVYVGKVTEWTPPPRKAAISIRLDEDVLAFFKAQQGPYQSHINAVLRSYMTAATKSDAKQASKRPAQPRRAASPKTAAE